LEEKTVRGRELMVKGTRKFEEENFSSDTFLLIYVLLEEINGQAQDKHK